MNRESRVQWCHEAEWMSHGAVTWEEAAVLAAKRVQSNMPPADCVAITVEVRDGDDIRMFLVRRNFTYEVEGLRGGE